MAKKTGKKTSKNTSKKSKQPKASHKTLHPKGRRFRSQFWFDNPNDPGMTALYFERYLNYGLTRKEIMGGRPIIGIAQTGSDLSPCNRHHLQLAERVREGIRDAGGIALEFPCHPIQETGKRPTAASIATSPISAWSRCCSAIRSMASYSPPAATRPHRRR